MDVSPSYKKFLISVNPWWEDPNFKFEIIDRPKYLRKLLPDQDNKQQLIKILIGARRVGKTTLMQGTINKLLEGNLNKKIIYLPADLKEIQSLGIRQTLESYADYLDLDLFKDSIHVFIDEVQELHEWQSEIKVLYDNTKINFYLTGSSSLILKKETSKLTGRFLLQHVFPLDFNEFQLFKTKLDHKTIQKSQLLEEYLEIGGYPEYVINRNKTYLKQAIESTLYRELLEYYGIRSPKLLNYLLELLADKITSPVSARRISRDLKIDDKTAKFYLEYLQAIYLIYPVYRYGHSHKISKSSVPKYYFNDTGVLNLYNIRSRLGHKIENTVFLHLLQKKLQEENPQIFYDVINRQEVDFRLDNKLYEVKGLDIAQLNKIDLEKYDLLDKKIKVIYHDNNYSQEKLYKDLPHYQNLELVNLVGLLEKG